MSASHSTTLAHNTSALFARISRNSDLVIVPINDCARAAASKAPSFFCVHSVSGAAGTDFQDLADLLDPDVRFFGIQAPPKRIDSADFGVSIDAMAEYYVESLLKFQPHGPYMLGGYCVGAVIALEMARKLESRGHAVGPLVAIDGVPENTGVTMRRFTPRYLIELARNLRGWIVHADLMRSRSIRSLMWSISNNASSIGKSAIGLKRGQKLGGGYSLDGIMDMTRFSTEQRLFINRLFGALFAHTPDKYSGDIVVYEAKITRLLYLPLIGRIWVKYAPQAEIVGILGTHIGMMRNPYVGALASDLRARVARYFNGRLPSGS